MAVKPVDVGVIWIIDGYNRPVSGECPVKRAGIKAAEDNRISNWLAMGVELSENPVFKLLYGL